MGPHSLWTSAAPCLIAQEPRAGPLHPTDVCSPLLRPVVAKGWATTPHGHLQLPARTSGAQRWAPTPDRVLQLPHQQLCGSCWLSLSPTASSPPGAEQGTDLPFLVLEAPYPDSRVCTTCTTCLIPVGVCHLRLLSVPSGLDEGLGNPGSTPWWDRLMVWALALHPLVSHLPVPGHALAAPRHGLGVPPMPTD